MMVSDIVIKNEGGFHHASGCRVERVPVTGVSRYSDECCTALRAKPLNRLLLFCGLTPPELKFRFLPLVCELSERDQ